MWVLVAVGVALRVWQASGGMSLFVDEIAIARNIAERSYAGILAPLDYGQVAPAGFLLVEKLLWSFLGGGDWTLRILPVAGAVTSVFLFRSLARRALSGIAVPLAVGWFGIGVPLIEFGAQAKPYATDVALALALTLLAIAVEETPVSQRRLVGAGLAGLLAPWFSQTAVLVEVGACIALGTVAIARRGSDARRLLLLVVVPWMIGAGAVLTTSLHRMSAATHAYLKFFWQAGFPPSPLTRASVWWPWQRLCDAFGPHMLGYRPASLFVVLGFVGFAALWIRRRPLALLLGAPLLVTGVAAVADQYPFANRLILFLVPSMLIMISAGVSEIAVFLLARSRIAAAGFLVLVLVPPVTRIARFHPVYRQQETRPLLAWLKERWRPGDVMYVHQGAVPAFVWYAPRFGLSTGDTVMGGCGRFEPRRFLGDIDRLRGRPRAWLFLENVNWLELRLILQYADSIGRRRDGLTIAPSSPSFGTAVQLELYDFTDSVRLRRLSADSLRATPPDYERQTMGCEYGPWSPRQGDQ